MAEVIITAEGAAGIIITTTIIVPTDPTEAVSCLPAGGIRDTTAAGGPTLGLVFAG